MVSQELGELLGHPAVAATDIQHLVGGDETGMVLQILCKLGPDSDEVAVPDIVDEGPGLGASARVAEAAGQALQIHHRAGERSAHSRWREPSQSSDCAPRHELCRPDGLAGPSAKAPHHRPDDGGHHHDR